ncbi:MAG: efflux RND transporter periplasmic adaptor subunit [Caulobacteraceae bacterium]|nr:efflux RND transporter periplasmic adaptor subunit [Caulobacteraceae bacterium]
MKRASLLLILLMAACAKAKDDDAKAGAPVALVTTAAVAQGTVAQTAAAYGAAEFAPDAERTLSAPVEAGVAQILAPAGTTVSAGQPIVILKPSPASQIDLNKAQADAAAASAAYDRAKRLRATGLDSDADVETAKAAAVAATDLARSLTARFGAALTLRAPSAGVVESLTLAPGDLVAQGAAVAKIGALTGLRLRFGLEPGLAGALHVGGAVRIAPLAGGEELAGQVVSVDPRLDAQTRLASVFVRAPSGHFAPGEPLKATLILNAQAGADTVPRAAILYDQEQPYVFVAQKGVAHRRDVKLGAEQGDDIAVTSGLAPGERVAVEGASALDDGMAVREGKAAAPEQGEAK